MARTKTTAPAVTGPMKAITVMQPRAFFIANGNQGVIAYDDDTIRSFLKEKERVAIHAPGVFDQGEFEIVKRHLIGPKARAKYSSMSMEKFSRDAIVCTALIWSMRWLDDSCRGGCLCDPRGKFGLTLVKIQVLAPVFSCRQQARNGEVWQWNAKPQESYDQGWLL